MSQQLTLRQQLSLWRNGDSDIVFNTWNDWFCSDKALYNKGNQLFKKLSMVVDSSKLCIDQDKTYVWFKNNYPCSGIC